MYFPVGRNNFKKRVTDFEADRWPETGDFFFVLSEVQFEFPIP